MSTNHNIVIKSYWLLRFIEGEGCFSIQKQAKSLTIISSFILTHTIKQTARDGGYPNNFK
jgi:hypothetical protein